MSTDAQKRASTNYNRKQDNIMVRPSKEEGAVIRAAAVAAGKSVQGYVLEAVREKMERERAGDDGSSTGGQFPYFPDGEDTPLVAVGSSPTGGEESLSAEPDFSKMAVEEWVEWKRRRTGESDRTWYERVSRSINTISKVGCSSYWSYLSKLSLAEKDILDRKNWRG